MEFRTIGSLRVSAIGLGCNNFGGRLDESATARVVNAALDSGINFFDTATIYGGEGRSEVFLGKALKARRGEAIIASKFGHQVEGVDHPGSPEYVRRALDASLRRLGVDQIDLYQQHQPDPTVPVAETLGALGELVRAGKVREIGASNFSVTQLRSASDAARGMTARFVSVQNEYSIFHREPEREMLALTEQLGVGFLPYFPLANGLLTGKYRRDRAVPSGSRLSEARKSSLLSPENLDRVEALATFAAGHHHTLLELAFSWLLAHQSVASVIAGATTEEQVRANAAAGSWQLREAELLEVDRIAPEQI